MCGIWRRWGSQPEAYIATVPGGMQYGGEYLRPVGAALAAEYGDKFAETPEAEWLDLFREFAVEEMLKLIREDLAALGVVHDVFSSERAMVEAGGVEAALAQLAARGLIYEGCWSRRRARRRRIGSRASRLCSAPPISAMTSTGRCKKSDGSNTYFANDMAYHADKMARGFDAMIDVWGADHGGYVKRMQAAVKALGAGQEARLDVSLCQIVRVMKDGQPVRMSKRAGTFVELRDLIDEVGPNAVRFFMLMRKSDAQMDFDLNAAVAQTRDNPVFYVQYAHARCRSVLRAAGEVDAGAELGSLAAPEELVVDPPVDRLAAHGGAGGRGARAAPDCVLFV